MSRSTHAGCSTIRILGIDPGSRVMGYAVVEECSGQTCLIAGGTLRPDASAAMSVRVARLFRGVADLIDQHQPHAAAMEEIFTAKNVASALTLGQARGAIMAACGVHGLDVTGYAPTAVKQALVGTGRADKEQVAFMVAQLLKTSKPYAKDATDAMAVAICHLNHRRFARLTGAK